MLNNLQKNKPQALKLCYHFEEKIKFVNSTNHSSKSRLESFILEILQDKFPIKCSIQIQCAPTCKK